MCYVLYVCVVEVIDQQNVVYISEVNGDFVFFL